MKSKITQYTFFVVLCFLSGQTVSPAFAAISNINQSSYQCAPAIKTKKAHGFKHRASKFGKRVKEFFRLKSMQYGAFLEGEKASTLAKASLFLFLGSIGLNLLANAVAIASVAIGVIVSLAFLASIVLAFVVLFGDENRKSRAIAKAVLWVTGIMVLLTLVLIGFLFFLFAGL
jgi:hypothetical protein